MFGSVVRAHRRRQGLTQEDLAELSGVSVRNIRDIETGRVGQPRPATVRQLARALSLHGAEGERFLAQAFDGAAPAGRSGWPAPAQLPPETGTFVGRAAQLRHLDGALIGTGQRPKATVFAITGPPGVGKTTLAVRWARRVLDRFPDGQLHADLRGYGPGRMLEPAEVIGGFLDAFGMAAESTPGGLAARTALYRSFLADRRVLILLDNARDAAQVRPLLPGASGCVVLVTSRNPLTGLVAVDGARSVTLDLLSVAEATQLLGRRVGTELVAAHPEAVSTIIDRCQRLPLALAVVAARLATESQLTVTGVARQLASTAGTGPFASDDEAADLAAVFSWSYRVLSEPAAMLFRRLSLHPGPDLSPATAAVLADVPPDRVGRLLAELTRTQLVFERAPGRFAMHDLLRSYAAEQAGAVGDPESPRTTLRRLLDDHLSRASAAARLLEPHREALDSRFAPPSPGAASTGTDPVLGWLRAERASLLALVGAAAEHGFPRHAWQLAWALTTFLQRGGHWHEQLAVQRVALTAAVEADDHNGQSHCHRGIARALFRLDRYAEAYRHLRQALDLAERAGDPVGQARAHHGLAYALERQNRHVEAIRHHRWALELFRSAGHHDGGAQALNSIAWNHILLNEPEQALDRAGQALIQLRELGDRHGEATTWDTLGRAHVALGDHRRAVTCYQRAWRMFRALGDRFLSAEALTGLSEVYRAAGDVEAAERARRRAIRIRLELAGPGPVRTGPGPRFRQGTGPWREVAAPPLSPATGRRSGAGDDVRVVDRLRGGADAAAVELGGDHPDGRPV